MECLGFTRLLVITNLFIKINRFENIQIGGKVFDYINLVPMIVRMLFLLPLIRI